MESDEFTTSSGELPDEDQNDIEEDVLDHLHTLDNKTSQKKKALQEEREAVLRALSHSGLAAPLAFQQNSRVGNNVRGLDVEMCPVISDGCEADWCRTYEKEEVGGRKP